MAGSSLSEDFQVIPKVLYCWTPGQDIKSKSNFKSPYVQFLRYSKGRGQEDLGCLRMYDSNNHQEVHVNTLSQQPYTSPTVPVCLSPEESWGPTRFIPPCTRLAQTLSNPADTCLLVEWKGTRQNFNKTFKRRDVKTKGIWTRTSENQRRIIVQELWLKVFNCPIGGHD